MACGVLSGNRHFEGRLCDCVRANYLASPPLVVAYALAGTVGIDFEKEPLGKDGARQQHPKAALFKPESSGNFRINTEQSEILCFAQTCTSHRKDDKGTV